MEIFAPFTEEAKAHAAAKPILKRMERDRRIARIRELGEKYTELQLALGEAFRAYEESRGKKALTFSLSDEAFSSYTRAIQELEDFFEKACFEEALLGLVRYSPSFDIQASAFTGRYNPRMGVPSGDFLSRVEGPLGEHLATRDGELFGIPEATGLKKAFTRYHLAREIWSLAEEVKFEMQMEGDEIQSDGHLFHLMERELMGRMGPEHAFLEALIRTATLAGEFGAHFEKIPTPSELEASWGTLEELKEELEIEELMA